MPVRAVLLDLEGVLYLDGAPISGAAEALVALESAGLDLRFVTNTTTTSREGVFERLVAAGVTVPKEALFTPLAAACAQLRQWGSQRIHLAVPKAARVDFEAFDVVDNGPVDAVVLGDLYKDYDWERLNGLFGLLEAGANFLALHKNRVCRRDGEIALDAGPFVAALEYATGRTATVVGKPSQAFFRLALDDLGVAPDAALMVGDDIEADIGGAQGAGLRAVQVETGKYTAADRDHPLVTPDARIPSIAELPALIEQLG